jgi:hypothetical protein
VRGGPGMKRATLVMCVKCFEGPSFPSRVPGGKELVPCLAMKKDSLL